MQQLAIHVSSANRLSEIGCADAIRSRISAHGNGIHSSAGESLTSLRDLQKYSRTFRTSAIPSTKRCDGPHDDNYDRQLWRPRSASSLLPRSERVSTLNPGILCRFSQATGARCDYDELMDHQRAGTVLLIVLIVVSLLTFAGLAYLQAMHCGRRCVSVSDYRNLRQWWLFLSSRGRDRCVASAGSSCDVARSHTSGTGILKPVAPRAHRTLIH